MAEKRFFVATEFKELAAIALLLEELGYDEKDFCIDEYSHEQQKILIDCKDKSWWFTDDECLRQSKEIIKLKFKDITRNIKLKDIEQWQN